MLNSDTSERRWSQAISLKYTTAENWTILHNCFYFWVDWKRGLGVNWVLNNFLMSKSCQIIMRANTKWSVTRVVSQSRWVSDMNSCSSERTGQQLITTTDRVTCMDCVNSRWSQWYMGIICMCHPIINFRSSWRLRSDWGPEVGNLNSSGCNVRDELWLVHEGVTAQIVGGE